MIKQDFAVATLNARCLSETEARLECLRKAARIAAGAPGDALEMEIAARFARFVLDPEAALDVAARLECLDLGIAGFEGGLNFDSTGATLDDAAAIVARAGRYAAFMASSAPAEAS